MLKVRELVLRFWYWLMAKVIVPLKHPTSKCGCCGRVIRYHEKCVFSHEFDWDVCLDCAMDIISTQGGTDPESGIIYDEILSRHLVGVICDEYNRLFPKKFKKLSKDIDGLMNEKEKIDREVEEASRRG